MRLATDFSSCQLKESGLDLCANRQVYNALSKVYEAGHNAIKVACNTNNAAFNGIKASQSQSKYYFNSLVQAMQQPTYLSDPQLYRTMERPFLFG